MNWIWLRIGTRGRLLWTWSWTFRFHKIWEFLDYFPKDSVPCSQLSWCNIISSISSTTLLNWTQFRWLILQVSEHHLLGNALDFSSTVKEREMNQQYLSALYPNFLNLNDHISKCMARHLLHGIQNVRTLHNYLLHFQAWYTEWLDPQKIGAILCSYHYVNI